MGRLQSALSKCDQERLKRWLVLKQSCGFQGRPNKDPDTCYSFWIGATLKLLGGEHLINREKNLDFIDHCTNWRTGGITKHPGGTVDALHTYLALSALSLDIMDARINITSLSLSTFEKKRTISWHVKPVNWKSIRMQCVFVCKSLRWNALQLSIGWWK